MARTAAELTQQLLAFARNRPRSNQVIPVNRVVTESAALLWLLLGARIELKIELGGRWTGAGRPMSVVTNTDESCR